MLARLRPLKIDLKKTVQLHDGTIARCCFEIKFFDKTLLLIIDQYKLYEIISDDENNKIYIELTNSWFCPKILIENQLFTIQGQLNYHNQITPDCLIIEEFFSSQFYKPRVTSGNI